MRVVAIFQAALRPTAIPKGEGLRAVAADYARCRSKFGLRVTMAHVFISYLREDEPLVGRLATMLAAYEVTVWVDRERIQPGTRWQDAIRAAIRDGAFFLACFSNTFRQRPDNYMKEEIDLALQEAARVDLGKHGWLLPISLDGCVPPNEKIKERFSLSDIQYIDLGKDWYRGVEQLLSVISPGNDTVQRCIHQLRSESARARVKAIDSLAILGPLSKNATPELRRLLADDNGTVQAAAADALGRIGFDDYATLQALLKVMATTDSHLRYPRLHATATASRAVFRFLPELWSALESPGCIHRNEIWKAIDCAVQDDEDRASISREGRAKIVLRNELARGQAASPAAAAVVPVILKDEQPVDVLVNLLTDENRSFDLRSSAARVLGSLGKEADAALPALEAIASRAPSELWRSGSGKTDDDKLISECRSAITQVKATKEGDEEPDSLGS
jgi:hypothetical protein